jgi:hypothetical protein
MNNLVWFIFGGVIALFTVMHIISNKLYGNIRVKKRFNVYEGEMWEVQRRLAWILWVTVFEDDNGLPYWFKSKEDAESDAYKLRNKIGLK